MPNEMAQLATFACHEEEQVAGSNLPRDQREKDLQVDKKSVLPFLREVKFILSFHKIDMYTHMPVDSCAYGGIVFTSRMQNYVTMRTMNVW